MEHENTAVTVITALCEISESLASVTLAITLYPHEIMQHAVSMLYAHIIRFLIRAWSYYEESSLRRAIHAITRPSALRYNDLIEAIQRDMDTVRRNAAASNQAEIRVLHRKVDELSVQMRHHFTQSQVTQQRPQNQVQMIFDAIQGIRQVMEFEKAVRSSDRIQIQSALSEIQFSQALALISSQCTIDHKAALNTAVQMQKTRQFRRSFQQQTGRPFWTSSKLREWNHSPESSTILLNSKIRDRNLVRGFCTEVVDYLVKAHTTVLWVFSDRCQHYSLLEALKSLIFQAISFGSSRHSANKMAFQFNRFLDAHFEEDYLNILADILQCSKSVYIITATDALLPGDAVHYRTCLCRLASILNDRGSKTVVKIISTSYGHRVHQGNVENLVLNVGKTERRRQRGHGAFRTGRHKNQSVDEFMAVEAGAGRVKGGRNLTR